MGGKGKSGGQRRRKNWEGKKGMETSEKVNKEWGRKTEDGKTKLQAVVYVQ